MPKEHTLGPPEKAILPSPNKVHWVVKDTESTLCGLDWRDREYETGVADRIADTIGICKVCEREKNDIGTRGPQTTKEYRQEVAEVLDDVTPRPNNPEILNKPEWIAIHEAVVKED